MLGQGHIWILSVSGSQSVENQWLYRSDSPPSDVQSINQIFLGSSSGAMRDWVNYGAPEGSFSNVLDVGQTSIEIAFGFYTAGFDTDMRLLVYDGSTVEQNIGVDSRSAKFDGSDSSKQYNVTGLDPDTTYDLILEVRNDMTSNDWYEIESETGVTTDVADPPSTPTNVTATKDCNDCLNGDLTWDHSDTSNVDDFEIEVDKGSGYQHYRTVSGTSTAISGQDGESHTYRVRACNAGGCSGWSDTDSVNWFTFG